MLDILIPFKKKTEKLIQLIKTIQRQTDCNDNIMLIDIGCVDGVTRDSFPPDSNIKYFKFEKNKEIETVNTIIRKFCINEFVLLMSADSEIINNETIQTLKTDLKKHDFILLKNKPKIAKNKYGSDPRSGIKLTADSLHWGGLACKRLDLFKVDFIDSSGYNSIIKKLEFINKEPKLSSVAIVGGSHCGRTQYIYNSTLYKKFQTGINVVVPTKHNIELISHFQSCSTDKDKVAVTNNIKNVKDKKFCFLISPQLTTPTGDILNLVREKLDTNIIIAIDNQKKYTNKTCVLFDIRYIQDDHKTKQIPQVIESIIKDNKEDVTWITEDDLYNALYVEVKKPSHENKPSNPKIQNKNSNKKHIVSLSTKPKVVFVCDVVGWAWWNKSHNLKRYLSDDFDIDIISVDNGKRSKIDPRKYDLYFTFGFSYVGKITSAPFNRRITGITAHRPHNIIRPKMNMAYATHANSMLLFNELKTLHNRPYYTPNGVSIDDFYIKKEIDPNTPLKVGHVGKLCGPKHQKSIIEPACKKAKVEYIPNYNNFTNKIEHKDMIDYYNSVDVLLFCSSEDGTPNGMLEAAACGRPTIINHIGNAPEFIKNDVNGFIVDKSIESFTKKLIYIKNNKDQVVEMGKEAYKTVCEEWTWEHNSKYYKDMLNDIIERK